MESETGGRCQKEGPSPDDSGTPANSEDDTTNTGISAESSESDIFTGASGGGAARARPSPAAIAQKKGKGAKERQKRVAKELKKCKRKASSRVKTKHQQQQQQQQQQLYQASGLSDGDQNTSTESLEMISHRIYVTSAQIGLQVQGEHFFEKFRATIVDVIGNHRFKLYQTASGLIATFYNEKDLNQVLATDLAKKQGVPVKVSKFTRTGPCYRRYVLIGHVPWCVPLTDIRSALLRQGLHPGKVTRVQGEIRVELHNSSDVERLLLEGFNFYNSACYPTTLKSTVNAKAKEQNVVQCYRCQGYWHTSRYCHEKPRCVRCGGGHELEYCLRPRSDPTCCHCGGPHHAAYKGCPVRVRIMKSTQIAFSLGKAGASSPF